MTHKLIEYTNLLHRHNDVNAKEVKAYFEREGAKDELFQKRARKLNALFAKSTDVRIKAPAK